MGRFLGSFSQHDLMIVYTSSGQCSGLSSRPPLLMKLITSLTGYSTWGKGKEVKCVAGAYAQLVTNTPIIQYKLYTLLAWYMPVHHHMYKPKVSFQVFQCSSILSLSITPSPNYTLLRVLQQNGNTMYSRHDVYHIHNLVGEAGNSVWGSAVCDPSAFPKQSLDYGRHCICRCWRMIGPAKYGPPGLNIRVYGCYLPGIKGPYIHSS